jgi:hypothetical protein
MNGQFHPLTSVPWRKPTLCLRVGGWIGHSGGHEFLRRAKYLEVNRIETQTILHVEQFSIIIHSVVLLIILG